MTCFISLLKISRLLTSYFGRYVNHKSVYVCKKLLQFRRKLCYVLVVVSGSLLRLFRDSLNLKILFIKTWIWIL